jgi:hypothetical protein
MSEHVQVVGTHNAIAVGDPARDLARTFSERLLPWGGPNHLGAAGTGRARALAAVDLLDGALRKLGDRDRKNVKASLVAQRSEIMSAIVAVDELVGDPDILIGLLLSGDLFQRRRLTGARFLELVATVDQAEAERREADRKMHFAVGADNVRAGRDAIDLAEAGQRHASREVAATLEAITYPSLPDAGLFADAKNSTEQLLRLDSAKPTARSMHDALNSGLNARPGEARLWCIYEGNEAHKLIELRQMAFEERG